MGVLADAPRCFAAALGDDSFGLFAGKLGECSREDKGLVREVEGIGGGFGFLGGLGSEKLLRRQRDGG